MNFELIEIKDLINSIDLNLETNSYCFLTTEKAANYVKFFNVLSKYIRGDVSQFALTLHIPNIEFDSIRIFRLFVPIIDLLYRMLVLYLEKQVESFDVSSKSFGFDFIEIGSIISENSDQKNFYFKFKNMIN